jgi:hypothetical protein
MFNLREFIKKGLISAVGEMADYQVILNAAGWHEKGVLDESDLAEISALIDARHVEETEEITENKENILMEEE